MLLPSLEDLTSAKVMIDETPTQDSFAQAEEPAQEMPSQELFVHSEGPVFQEAFAVVVLTHEAFVRATGTTNEKSLQRRLRLVEGAEAQAVVFDRGKVESTIGQISFFWSLRLFLYHKIGSYTSRTCWKSGERYLAIPYLFAMNYIYLHY